MPWIFYIAQRDLEGKVITVIVTLINSDQWYKIMQNLIYVDTWSMQNNNVYIMILQPTQSAKIVVCYKPLSALKLFFNQMAYFVTLVQKTR